MHVQTTIAHHVGKARQDKHAVTNVCSLPWRAGLLDEIESTVTYTIGCCAKFAKTLLTSMLHERVKGD